MTKGKVSKKSLRVGQTIYMVDRQCNQIRKKIWVVNQKQKGVSDD